MWPSRSASPRDACTVLRASIRRHFRTCPKTIEIRACCMDYPNLQITGEHGLEQRVGRCRRRNVTQMNRNDGAQHFESRTCCASTLNMRSFPQVVQYPELPASGTKSWSHIAGYPRDVPLPPAW